MTQSYLYKHGLPFSESLVKNLDQQLIRINQKKSSCILLCGTLGSGKTTLLTHLVNYVNSKTGYPPMTLENGEPQLAMGGLEFIKKLRICYEKKLPCIGYDEAGDFSRRGSLTQFNAMLNRIFETYRAFRIIVILALPDFSMLDQALFDNGIPRFLIRCHDRTQTYGNFEGYSLYRMLWLKARMKEYKLKNYAYAKVEPNFYGHFLDLTPDMSKKLDQLSTSSKYDVLKLAEVKMEGLLTTIDMATKLMKSLNWVYIALRNLKLKPSRIINHVRYYSREVLAKLGDLANENSERVGRYDRNPPSQSIIPHGKHKQSKRYIASKKSLKKGKHSSNS